MMARAKYDKANIYVCPKCGTSGGNGVAPHNLTWQDRQKITDLTGKVVDTVAECLTLHCYYCGYLIGKFLPLDAE
jgi:hypothetical protein